MKKKIIIIGSGGHGRSCIDVVESTLDYTIEGIVDLPHKIGTCIFGYAVIASDENLAKLIHPDRSFLLGIGQISSPKIRKTLFSLLNDRGANLPVIISPHSYVSPHATIGIGTIVMHKAIVNAGAIIGNNCIINSMSLIEHDAIVGDNCHISTAAVINGDCVVGADTFVGSNTVLKNNIRIPDGSVIGAGQFII